jgi:hypothetical protein
LSRVLVDESNVWTPSHVSSFGGGVVSFILHLVILALLLVVLSSPFRVEGFYLPGSYILAQGKIGSESELHNIGVHRAALQLL